MRKISSSLLLFILICFSCRKDVGVNPGLTQIIIGDLHGVTSTNYDNATAADLNGDGNIDVSILTERIKIMGPIYSTKISLINHSSTIDFNTQTTTDTVYFNQSTSISYSIINDTITVINKATFLNHVCHRMDPKDNIEKIKTNQLRVKLLSLGEQIHTTAVFSAGDFVLLEPYDWRLSDQHGTWPDTVYVTKETFFDNCAPSITAEKKYICFKMKISKNDKIGWICLNNTSNGICISESAISQ